MVTVVIIINLAITVVLLYVAKLVWRLRRRLARIADILTAVELNTQASLRGTPDAISRGRLAIHQLGQRSQPLDLKLLRVQQVLSLFTLGQQIWQRFSYGGASRSLLGRQSKNFSKVFVKRGS